MLDLPIDHVKISQSWRRFNLDMKTFPVLLFVGLGLLSCNKEPTPNEGADHYEFVTAYTANITVGGIVGVAPRTFYVGEVYSGTDYGNTTVTLRIADHTEINEDCPNPWCYQEFLEVPKTHLRLLP